MKTKIYLILLVTAFSKNLHAQAKLSEGNVKAQNITFSVKKVGQLFKVKNTKNNSIDLAKMNDIENVRYYDDNSVFNSFLKVFDKERLKKLIKERYMVVNFYFDHTGLVKSIDFFTPVNTSITPLEFESLESTLKSNVKFNLNRSRNVSDNNRPITQSIFYEKLYNKL